MEVVTSDDEYCDDEDIVEEEWNLSLLDSKHDKGDQVDYVEGVYTASASVVNNVDDVIRKNDATRSSTAKIQSSPVERMSLNDHKAGMQGLDKEKINKIIHQASKGSKYYENERRKESKTKERIDLVLKELQTYSEVEKAKAFVLADQVIDKLSKNIDLSRTLVHIDMDAFYAAVEMRDNPELKNVPMAVGGNSMLCTSNYLARKFGVRAAMPGFIARKLCPNLKIIPCNFDKYRAVSKDIRAIFSEYDPNFSPMSLDEAYLDLTEFMQENFYKYKEEAGKDLVEIIVEEIRCKIVTTTNLTASAGIAPNMMLAKISSDLNKPNGQYYLKPDIEKINEFVQKLPIRKVFGIGKVSEQMLKALRITTCKDLYLYRNVIYLLFRDTSFDYYMNVYLGISSNRIEHSERKSMSVERTFQNESKKEELEKICYSICENLSTDLLEAKLKGRNITLKYKLSNFISKTRAKTISYAIYKTEDIYVIAKEILDREINSYKPPNKFELRLMGVRMCQFTDDVSKKPNTVDRFFTEKKPVVEKPLSEVNTETSPEQQGRENHENTETSSEASLETSSKASTQARSIASLENSNKTSLDDLVECPVCGVLQVNEMVALNQHIDSCLTKKAIKEIIQEQDFSQTSASNSSTSDTLLPYNSTTSKSKKRKSSENIKSSKKKVTLHSFWKT